MYILWYNNNFIHLDIPTSLFKMIYYLIFTTDSDCITFRMFCKKSIIPSSSSPLSTSITSKKTSRTDYTVDSVSSKLFIFYRSDTPLTLLEFISISKLYTFIDSSLSIWHKDSLALPQQWLNPSITRNLIIHREIEHDNRIISKQFNHHIGVIKNTWRKSGTLWYYIAR